MKSSDVKKVVKKRSQIRVFIAGEFSGVVRRAFREKGFDAWSCDLLDSEDMSPFHIKDDLFNHINDGWDLMIAHPECTFLANSGNRWLAEPGRAGKRMEAVQFVQRLAKAPIKHIAIENPIGYLSTAFRKPDQIIQPWQYGHGEVKATCLWLQNLPVLVPTKTVDGRFPKVHRAAPGKDRWKERARTLPGIAMAMAMQWGPYVAYYKGRRETAAQQATVREE
jgi:hypothetical protein